MSDKKDVNTAALIAALALLMLAAKSSGQTVKATPKKSKYDWIDHVSGLSLIDKILDIK